jgi:hypothetical protein
MDAVTLRLPVLGEGCSSASPSATSATETRQVDVDKLVHLALAENWTANRSRVGMAGVARQPWESVDAAIEDGGLGRPSAAAVVLVLGSPPGPARKVARPDHD